MSANICPNYGRSLLNVSDAGPNYAFSADVGPSLAKPSHIWPIPSLFAGIAPHVVDVGPMLVQFAPNLVDFGQAFINICRFRAVEVAPDYADVGPELIKVGRSLVNVGRIWPTLVDLGPPNAARNLLIPGNGTDFGRAFADLGFGRGIWPTSADFRPDVVQIRPGFGQISASSTGCVPDLGDITQHAESLRGRRCNRSLEEKQSSALCYATSRRHFSVSEHSGPGPRSGAYF